MLDNEESKRRIVLALKSAPRGTQAAIARELGITEQAIHGWKAAFAGLAGGSNEAACLLR